MTFPLNFSDTGGKHAADALGSAQVIVAGHQFEEGNTMARKTVVTLTDDIDGELADETVRFGIDGVYYEIDLRESNARKLREILQPYRSAARRTSPPTRGKASRSRSSAADRARSAEIRAWARRHGLPVSERGRISAALIAAYKANDPSRLKGTGSDRQG